MQRACAGHAISHVSQDISLLQQPMGTYYRHATPTLQTDQPAAEEEEWSLLQQPIWEHTSCMATPTMQTGFCKGGAESSLVFNN